MKKKIGIFGCTADPFTVAHREIVKQALDQHLVDEVIIAPTIVDWHRKGKSQWLDDSQKTEVIERLLVGLESKTSIYTKDLDVRKMSRGNASLEKRFVEQHRFIDTLVDIKALVGADAEVHVIVGNDSWENFETWSNWKDIACLAASILVADGRSGHAKFKANPSIPNARPFKIDKKFANVSASSIREKFTSCESYIAQAEHEIESSSKLMLHTPIFDVVKGKKTKTGLVPVLVNAPDWVTVIVEKDGKLLVEKQFRYGTASMIEEFPCGMVEPGEEPRLAAVRELEEETGIKLLDDRDLVELGAVSPNPAFMTNTMHYFYVDLDSAKHQTTRQKLDQHEQIQFYYKSIDSFCHHVMDTASSNEGPRKVPALLVAALMLFGYNIMDN